MDPFSITASVVTLIQVSAQVTVLVKQFRDEVNVVDTTLNGILNDVDGFQQVLQSMKETFAQEDIQADVQATGHVGNHWKNLARSLSDGESTLEQLRSLLTSVNKSTSFLDASRKQLRLKSALAQISGFREQIQSYRAALQLSLSTIIVWNQVSLQKSTAKLPEKLMPDLNKLYDQIRNLGADLNAKIGRLETTVVNQGFHAESELISMTNLKECVESAADVVSTASTTLGPEGSERASVKYGSDFGDVFKKDSNETMQRWMSSNTVYEFDDVEAPTLDPSEASTGDTITVYESDSDSDIEHELVRALFNNGKRRKEQGDLRGAERHLRNCLSRFPSTTSYTSLASSQTSSATSVSKAELLELLTETYCSQGSWTQAKSTMKEKLAITERQTGKKSERFLWDSFRLCEVLMNTKDYTEAQLHGRQSLRGFRKLREQGHTGYEKTLNLLIQICHEQGNLEDEEAYTALLGSHQSNLKTKQQQPASMAGSVTNVGQANPLTDGRTQPAECEPNACSDTRGSIEPTLIEPVSTDDGNQPRLRKLTPKPLFETPQEETPLSPSSSASAEMWSPTAHAARVQTNSSTFGGTLNRTAPMTTSSRNVEALPKTVSAYQNRSTTAKDTGTEDKLSSTKLLISLCQQENGQKPIFMIGRSREGYNCIVFADEARRKEIAKVTNCLTKEEARHAAAARAYKTLVSLSTKSVDSPSPSSRAVEGSEDPKPSSPGMKDGQIMPRDTSADPPAYTLTGTPSHLTSPTGFLQDIPEIMVSPTFNDATFARPESNLTSRNSPVRRAASDSRLPSQKMSSNGPALNTFSPEAYSQSLHAASTIHSLQTHRRAASTSARPPGWPAGDNSSSSQPTGLAISMSIPQHENAATDKRKGSKAQPNVTFDTIESSAEQADQSDHDPVTPTSKSRSLFPNSLAKTFSLQDRRTKSDDPNLAKKKSFRFGLGSSSKRRSPVNVSPETRVADEPQALASARVCPICSATLKGLGDDEAWSHVDSCLGGSSPPIASMTYELPVSGFDAVELPASMPALDRTVGPHSPMSDQHQNALSDLHRAFSRRDLSADKFEIEDEVRVVPPTPMSPLSRFETNPLQRQVLLLGDTKCGKTWLSSAWCNGTIPKHTSLSATRFIMQMGSLEIVIQDHATLDRLHDHMRHASYGVVHAVLLCFDISSPVSFENVEHKWNHEADLYLKNVPKILVGCKKDINRGGPQTVWTRDAYKLTARISARAYFETSAVTMEGLDVLFNHVARIAAR